MMNACLERLQLDCELRLRKIENETSTLPKENLWSTRIKNVSSLYECKTIYQELHHHRFSFQNELFKDLVYKIIIASSELNYSHALTFAEKLGELEQIKLTNCEPYLSAKNNRKDLLEKSISIQSTFNHSFSICQNQQTVCPLEFIITKINEQVEPLDETDPVSYTHLTLPTTSRV